MILLVVWLLFVFIYGPANMTHELSSACAETILSYHNSLQQNCFTHKLEPVTSLLCVVGRCFVFLFGFVFGVLRNPYRHTICVHGIVSCSLSDKKM